MSENHVDLKDLGSSRVLSRGQARWLDGEDDALAREDRKIRSEVRARVESAIRELQFVNERSEKINLDHIARPPVRSNGNGGLSTVDEPNVRNAMGTAEMLAGSMGEGESINFFLKSLSEVPENASDAQMVAQLVEAIFARAGYDEDEYSEQWGDFSEEVRQHLDESD